MFCTFLHLRIAKIGNKLSCTIITTKMRISMDPMAGGSNLGLDFLHIHECKVLKSLKYTTTLSLPSAISLSVLVGYLCSGFVGGWNRSIVSKRNNNINIISAYTIVEPNIKEKQWCIYSIYTTLVVVIIGRLLLGTVYLVWQV